MTYTLTMDLKNDNNIEWTSKGKYLEANMNMCGKCIDTYLMLLNNVDQSVSLSVSKNTSFNLAEECSMLCSDTAELQPCSAVINPRLKRAAQNFISSCSLARLHFYYDCFPQVDSVGINDS